MKDTYEISGIEGESEPEKILRGKIVPVLSFLEDELEKGLTFKFFFNLFRKVREMIEEYPMWNSVFILRVRNGKLKKYPNIQDYLEHPNETKIRKVYSLNQGFDVSQIPFFHRGSETFYMIPQAIGVRRGTGVLLGACDDVKNMFQQIKEQFEEKLRKERERVEIGMLKIIN